MNLDWKHASRIPNVRVRAILEEKSDQSVIANTIGHMERCSDGSDHVIVCSRLPFELDGIRRCAIGQKELDDLVFTVVPNCRM